MSTPSSKQTKHTISILFILIILFIQNVVVYSTINNNNNNNNNLQNYNLPSSLIDDKNKNNLLEQIIINANNNNEQPFGILEVVTTTTTTSSNINDDNNNNGQENEEEEEEEMIQMEEGESITSFKKKKLGLNNQPDEDVRYKKQYTEPQQQHYSAPTSSECEVIQHCRVCDDQERSQPFCQKTGYSKTLKCKGRQPVKFSCTDSGKLSTNILFFEVGILTVLLVSLYFVRERKKFMLQLHNERLTKQLNKV